jgi:hypothetical protein
VTITGYDVGPTAASGFGGWAHVYTGTVTDTGRQVGGSASCDPPQPPCLVVNETGGGGSLNDGVVSADSSVNQLITNRSDTAGVPIAPVITLHLGVAVRVQTITIFGDGGPSIFSGAINAATVTIDSTAVALSPPASGPVDVLDLRGTPLAAVPTDTVQLSDFTAEWLPFFPSFDQFSIGEITVDGLTAPADSTPPVLTLPVRPVIAEATATAGAIVTFAASALDATDGPVPVTCVPASGSRFAIGETVVRCSATDGAGNAAAATFIVRVQVTPGGLCSLTHQYVSGSAKYQALPPSRRKAIDALAAAACAHLNRIVKRLTPSEKRALVARYKQSVDALAGQRWLTAGQAVTLKSLADRL